jgi:hypothetical protein
MECFISVRDFPLRVRDGIFIMWRMTLAIFRRVGLSYFHTVCRGKLYSYYRGRLMLDL